MDDDEVYMNVLAYMRNLSEIISDKATGRKDNFLMSCHFSEKEMLKKAWDISVDLIRLEMIVYPDYEGKDAVTFKRRVDEIKKQTRFKELNT